MAEYLLSGYAYFPPIETTITPHIETALITGNSPRFRRKTRYKLGPHHFLVYPPPPAQDPVKVPLEVEYRPAVSASRLPPRRKPRSVLRPHVGVVYAAPPSGVTELLGSQAAVRGSRYSPLRRPMWVLSPHVGVVYPQPPAGVTQLLGGRAAIRGSLAPRPRAMWVLGAPVVTAAEQRPMLGGIMVVLVRTPYPAILPMHTLGGPMVVDP